MTLNQILYFQKIARLENYHQAAEELYVSQPSLSRSMAALESELGVTLFEKKGRGVILTKAGRYFLEHADRIMAVYDNAIDDMHMLSTGGGKIDIGYVFPLAGYYIPHKVKQFLNCEENRKVVFSFFQDHTPAITRKLRTGELDVGFGGYPARDEMEYFPMFSQEIVLITPKEHPLADLEEVPLSCLAEYPIIGYDRSSWMGLHTRAFFRNYGLKTNVIVECPDEYSILAMVQENFGIALVAYVDFLKETEKIVVHKISDLRLYHQTFMFWMKDRYRTAAVNRFIEYMKEQAEPPIDNESALKIYLKDIVNF